MLCKVVRAKQACVSHVYIHLSYYVYASLSFIINDLGIISVYFVSVI